MYSRFIECVMSVSSSTTFPTTSMYIARGHDLVVACVLPNPTPIYRSRDQVRLSTIRYMSESHDVAPAITGWFLQGFLAVFHHHEARNSVKWTMRHHISEIPLSTTLNPNQTNKQTNKTNKQNPCI